MCCFCCYGYVVVYGGIVVVVMCCVRCCNVVVVMWLCGGRYSCMWLLYCSIVVVCGYVGRGAMLSQSFKNNNFHTTIFSKIFFIPLAEQMFAQTNVHTTLSHLYTKTLQIIQKDVIKMSIQIYRIIVQYFYLKVVTDYVP